MIFVKFDFPSYERLNEDNIPLLNHVSKYIHSYFEQDCFDMIDEVKNDGIMVLFNYPNEVQGVINAKLLELYDRISALLRPHKSLDTTICVSSVVAEACEVWRTKMQVRDAEWSRMRFGLNKIIFWNPVNSATENQVQAKLEPISNRLRLALETLNIAKFNAAINEFYNLSPTILSSHHARVFVRHQVLAALFQRYWDTIALFTSPSVSYDTISYSLHLCTTFERHRSTLLLQCSDLMEKIIAHSSPDYSPTILQVMDYVRNNTDIPIQLEDAAAEVHLSKVYFSYLFKKETGQNFTRYVNEQKNTVACELLRTSNLSISEIARRIGMEDIRAFSKKFHNLNGVTPSKYRQLHSSKAGSQL
jgi:two-component system response regulator YesN